MRQLQHSHSPNLLPTTYTYHLQPFYITGNNWNGPTVDQLTVNWSGSRTKSSEFSGHKPTYVLDDFENVIWSDGTMVQLETHWRHCYRKEGENPRPKPWPKHPVRVHVWAGISKKGATKACIFEGIMNAMLYCDILDKTLLPFIKEKFPAPAIHRFMQDNDPKHTSHTAQDYFTRSGIDWWKTPAESPDMKTCGTN